MEQQNYYNKFIISGGPGFGKTTLLKKLEERQKEFMEQIKGYDE